MSDFFTLIGRRNQNSVSRYEDDNGFVLYPGDLSNPKIADLIRVLPEQGGLSVQMNRPRSAPTVVVKTWKGSRYAPPTRLLILRRDNDAEPKEIAEKIQFSLNAGDRVLLPLDLDSQEGLDKLQVGLEHLPPDYEEIVLEMIRRPSLEARVERLEQMVRGKPPSTRDVPNSEQVQRGPAAGLFADRWALGIALFGALALSILIVVLFFPDRIQQLFSNRDQTGIEATVKEAKDLAAEAKSTAATALETAEEATKSPGYANADIKKAIDKAHDDAQNASTLGERAETAAQNASTATSANTAKQQAQAAKQKANTAESEANQAKLRAAAWTPDDSSSANSTPKTLANKQLQTQKAALQKMASALSETAGKAYGIATTAQQTAHNANDPASEQLAAAAVTAAQRAQGAANNAIIAVDKIDGPQTLQKANSAIADAQRKANDATTKATSAQTSADAARTHRNSGGGDTTTGKEREFARAARADADVARGYANDASTSASFAEADAATAMNLSQANEAVASVANDAQKAAEAARRNASDASKAADQAESWALDAEAAAGRADAKAAKTAADEGKKKAGEAKKKAEDAQNKAGEAKRKLGDVKTKIESKGTS